MKRFTFIVHVRGFTWHSQARNKNNISIWFDFTVHWKHIAQKLTSESRPAI